MTALSSGRNDPAAPVRVLVAEDDGALRRLMEMLLTHEGYEVRAVGDGTEALEVLAGWTPDAIVLDVMMPKLSGLSVCREVRAGGECTTVPIILLTARTFDEDIQAVMELGGITFMNKPFNPRQLLFELTDVVPDSAARIQPPAMQPGRLGWLAPAPSEIPTAQ